MNKKSILFYNKMSERGPQGLASDMNHQEFRQLEENCQLLELIGKKIKEQTSIKVGIVQLIDIDELPPSQGLTLVKATNQAKIPKKQSGQCKPHDQLYLPQQDSSQSEIVLKNKDHQLRERPRIITQEQFLRNTTLHQLIEIIDDSDQLDNYRQKQQHVKINFKEEGGRTKKTKIELLLKNRGMPWVTHRKKKTIVKKLSRVNKKRY